MVRAIAGNVFPPEVVADIARCAEGVPLFIEELTEMVAETELLRVTDGGQRFGTHQWPALPATLRETLVSRFRRLGTARDLAQVGATIGQEFDMATLRRASRLEDDLLLEDLDRLSNAGLLVRDGEADTATYRFKHVLVQDAAYGMMLKGTRRQLHRRVADALLEQPTDGRVAHAHVLAFHYTEAGMYRHAIGYWIEAGKGCLAWACPAEAQAHLRRARALLQLLPQKDRRPFESEVRDLVQQIGDLWLE
jgi:predicted ATPase